jgi:hypothetical protein
VINYFGENFGENFGEDSGDETGIEKHFREVTEHPCSGCGCPTFNPRLCNPCFELEYVVKARKWFVEAQHEWKAEQERKKRLITGEGYI